MVLSSVLASLVLVASSLSVVRAAPHGGVLSYNIGGTTYKGFVPYNTPSGQSSIQREWDTYDPIQDATDANLACNVNGAALAAQKTATVAAGSKVVAIYNTWPHTIGPVMVYMASCGGDCTAATPSALKWFKIDQSGLISGTYSSGLWGQAKLVADNSTWTSTIPATLAPGNYMLRHELLSIHSPNIPQFYPECAQLTITGSGSATPSSSFLVSFPGAYKASDPGVTLNVYDTPDARSYTIPGPAVWTG